MRASSEYGGFGFVASKTNPPLNRASRAVSSKGAARGTPSRVTTGHSSPGRSGPFISSESCATAIVRLSTPVASASARAEPRGFGLGTNASALKMRSASSQRTFTIIASWLAVNGRTCFTGGT
eukprot:scaffold3076_cov248-Pinguiococcus_pyrenoidosus.AAC.6